MKMTTKNYGQKILIGLASMFLTMNASAQRNVIMNGDFETGTTDVAPSGWTTATSATVFPQGLNSTLKCAKITATTGFLQQTFPDAGSEFTIDFSFAAVAPASRNRAMVFRVQGNLIHLMVKSDGILYFYDGAKNDPTSTVSGGWNPVNTAANAIIFSKDASGDGLGVGTGDEINTYRIRLVCHLVGTSGINYDIYLSSANSSTLNLIKTGAKYIHFAPSLTSRVTSIEFATASMANNYSYLVDDVSLTTRNQTINFPAIPTKTVGDAPFDLSATASSGLPIVYTSSNESVATISGSTVTIIGTGTAEIKATQAGDELSDAATEVVQTLTVSTVTKFKQVISDSNVAVVNRKVVVTGTNDVIKLYTLSGVKVDAGKSLKPGIYILNVGDITSKVVIR